MSPKFVLRSARPDDAAEIARLVAELGYAGSTEEIADRLPTLLSDARYHLVVAAQPGRQLLGWVNGEKRLTLESGVLFEIVGLVVDENARRLGVGKALVAAVESWAATLGASAVRVRSNISRPESHGFYEALGYERRKTQHAYVRTLPSPS